MTLSDLEKRIIDLEAAMLRARTREEKLRADVDELQRRIGEPSVSSGEKTPQELLRETLIPAARIDFTSATLEQWADVAEMVEEAIGENLGLTTTAIAGGGSGNIAIAAQVEEGGKPVKITIYKTGAVNTGGPEGELRANVREILRGLGLDVRC